jgi:hypothetical protein
LWLHRTCSRTHIYIFYQVSFAIASIMSMLYLLFVLAGLAFLASAAVERRAVPVLSLLSLSPCILHVFISFITHISHIRHKIKWRRRMPPTRAGRSFQNSCLLRAAKGSFHLLIQCWIFVMLIGIFAPSLHDALCGTVSSTHVLPVSTLTFLRSHSF